MNATDRAADQVATHTVDILRVAAGSRQKALAALRDLETELVRLIERGPTNINQNARLAALLRQTRETIGDAYRQISAEHRMDMKALARLGGEMSRGSLNAAIGVDIFGVAISAKQLETIVDSKSILGHSSAEWWRAQDAALRNKFAGGMQQGLLLGESITQLAERVTGTQAAGFTDGMMAAKDREASALVRSSAISVSNEARLRSLEQQGDVVEALEWVNTLDPRTCPICRALGGLKWTLQDKEPIGHSQAWPGVTAHWQCRCTQVAVLKSWEELSGKKLKSLGRADVETRMAEKLAARGWSDAKISQAVSRTRTSMDGAQSAGMDFDAWLNTKSDVAVNKMLGPGRAKLWQSGKADLIDLINQNNRPLTLKQLEASLIEGRPVPETLGLSILTTQLSKFKIVEATAEDVRAAEQVKKYLADPATRAIANTVITEHPDKSPSAQEALIEERIAVAKALAKKK